MFFRACRNHSAKSAKWGAFDTVCPLCLQVGGNCPLCPRLRRLCVQRRIGRPRNTWSSFREDLKKMNLSWDSAPDHCTGEKYMEDCCCPMCENAQENLRRSVSHLHLQQQHYHYHHHNSSSSSSRGTLEENSRFHDASPWRTIRCSQ